MITTHTNKQAKKQTNKQQSMNETMQQPKLICIFLIQSNEESLMKFAAVSVKILKTVKCLSKMFNIDIVDLCLLPCFYILFKRRLLQNDASAVVLANLKISEPIDT